MHTDNQHKNSYWCIIFKALAVCYTQMNSSAPPAVNSAGSAKEINVDFAIFKDNDPDFFPPSGNVN